MMYRFLYKRYFETKQAFGLVEDTIEADTFVVQDGNLLFCDDQGLPIFALPPTFWAIVEQADRTEQPASQPSHRRGDGPTIYP